MKLANVQRGAWKMRRIDSSVHPYVCIYVPIPGGSTCPRSLKPHWTLFSSLSSPFTLAWYAPVDKSRPPLLKDRGIGDKPESRNGDRAGGVGKESSDALRRDGEMIELNLRATRYLKNLRTRRCYAANEEQRRLRRHDCETGQQHPLPRSAFCRVQTRLVIFLETKLNNYFLLFYRETQRQRICRNIHIYKKLITIDNVWIKQVSKHDIMNNVIVTDLSRVMNLIDYISL